MFLCPENSFICCPSSFLVVDGFLSRATEFSNCESKFSHTFLRFYTTERGGAPKWNHLWNFLRCGINLYFEYRLVYLDFCSNEAITLVRVKILQFYGILQKSILFRVCDGHFASVRAQFVFTVVIFGIYGFTFVYPLCVLLEDIAGKLQFPTSSAAAAAAATAIALGQPQLGLMVCTLLLTNIFTLFFFRLPKYLI